MHSLRIIYMGTPEFAVAPLAALVENGFNIVAVVTVPDKPAGRGLQLTASPVKQFAQLHQIPVLQPVKLKDPEFISALKNFDADLQVVVAFRMLPEVVWQMPPKGTLNLHASLLPDYRGAAPINHAIIHGETETGITTFFLQHAIDTGDIIFKEKILISPTDNAGTLHDKLMAAGAALIVKTVTAIEENNYTLTPQSGTSEKTAPKIFKENCQINWDTTGNVVNNFIRGLSPYPGAYTLWNNKILKIYSGEFVATDVQSVPGTLLSDNKTFIRFAVRDGYYAVHALQAEGKKRMTTEEFLRGNKMN